MARRLEPLDAEDIVQEAAIVVWQRASEGRASRWHTALLAASRRYREHRQRVRVGLRWVADAVFGDPLIAHRRALRAATRVLTRDELASLVDGWSECSPTVRRARRKVRRLTDAQHC